MCTTCTYTVLANIDVPANKKNIVLLVCPGAPMPTYMYTVVVMGGLLVQNVMLPQ